MSTSSRELAATRARDIIDNLPDSHRDILMAFIEDEIAEAKTLRVFPATAKVVAVVLPIVSTILGLIFVVAPRPPTPECEECEECVQVVPESELMPTTWVRIDQKMRMSNPQEDMTCFWPEGAEVFLCQLHPRSMTVPEALLP